jgi:Cu2+-containing amine oxidase
VLDGQPLATPDDCLEAEAIARSDVGVQAAAAARGVPLAKVACDPWAIHACPPQWAGRRLMQVFMYFKDGPDDNGADGRTDAQPASHESSHRACVCTCAHVRCYTHWL